MNIATYELLIPLEIERRAARLHHPVPAPPARWSPARWFRARKATVPAA
jgi:hypothetical protein